MSLAALLLFLAAPAFAQDESAYVGLLDKAKAAIAAKDYKTARSLLTQAEAAAATNTALILDKDLARLPFYRGLVEWRDGDKDTAALNHWRDAITLSEAFAPEADVLPEAEGQDVYYALMGEVKGRESVTLGLPEDPGDAVIFVDGKRMEPFDAVLVGRHFIQLRCGEGNVVGSWYTFGAPPPDYLVLCSGGAYPVPKGGKAPKVKEAKGPSKAELAKAEKEAAKKAAAEAAAAEKLAKETAAKEAAEKAAADKAAADKAAADKATAEKAAKEAADKAAAEKATAEKAAKEAADKAAAEKATADKATADKAAKEAADKAAAEKATADKATADKATKEAADKAAADKAAADKAAADKAASDKAAADKAASDKAAKEAADKAAKEAADKAAAEKLAAAKAPKEPKDKDGTVGWVMIAGGGAMLAGGGAINFLVVNPAWTEAQGVIDDPRTATRAEADAIVSRFNTGRYATIGLLAAGVATAGVGVFLGPLESQFVVTPNGLSLSGRW